MTQKVWPREIVGMAPQGVPASAVIGVCEGVIGIKGRKKYRSNWGRSDKGVVDTAGISCKPVQRKTNKRLE